MRSFDTSKHGKETEVRKHTKKAKHGKEKKEKEKKRASTLAAAPHPKTIFVHGPSQELTPVAIERTTLGSPWNGFLVALGPHSWRAYLGFYPMAYDQMLMRLPEDPTGRLGELKLILILVTSREEAEERWRTCYRAPMPLHQA